MMTAAGSNAAKRRPVLLSVACLLISLTAYQFGCKQESTEQPSASASSTPSQSSARSSEKAEPAKPAEKPTATPSSTARTDADAELIGVAPDWQVAIKVAQQEAKAHPKDAAAIGRLGMLYLSADLSPQAAGYFEAAAKLAPQEAKWQYYLGLAHERAYALTEAVDAYKATLALRSDYVPAMIRLSQLMLTDWPDEAKATLLRASTLAPREPRILFMLAQIAHAEGDTESAEDYLQRCVAIAPDFASAHKLLAGIYEQQGEHGDAERHRSMAEGTDRVPNTPDPYWDELTTITHQVRRPLEYAEHLLKQGNTARAAEVLKFALQVEPDNDGLRRRYGQALDMLGRHEEALNELRKIPGDSPLADAVAVDIASTLTNAKKYDEAEAAFKAALDKWQATPEILRAYGSFMMLVGRGEEAVRLLEPLLDVPGSTPQDQVNLVLAYMCTRQFDKAAEQYKLLKSEQLQSQAVIQALLGSSVTMMLRQHQAGIDPAKQPAHLQPQHFILLADAFAKRQMEDESQALRNYVQLLANDAMRLADQGYYENALRYLDEVMSADIGGVLLNTKGAIYGIIGRPEQALSYFEQALKVNPGLSSARSGMVQALMDLGRTEEAGRLLDQIIADRPNDPAALQAYAMMLAGANRLEAALAFLSRAAELQPDNPSHHQIRADLLARAGRLDEALQAVEAALKIAPENAAARHLFAVCLNAAGRTEEAKAEWRKLIKANPRLIEPRMALVELAVMNGDNKQAQTLIREGIAESPNSPLLANALAWSLATCNEPALRHGREAVQLAAKACAITNYQQAEFIDTLAAAYAEAGDFKRAVEMQKRAIKAVEERGTGSTEGLEARLKLYEAGTAYRDVKQKQPTTQP